MQKSITSAKINTSLRVLLGALTVALAGALFFYGAARAATIFTDNFNDYNNGPLGGQGGWRTADGGAMVQDATVFEGSRAARTYQPYVEHYSSTQKSGNPTSDGSTTIHLRRIVQIPQWKSS